MGNPHIKMDAQGVYRVDDTRMMLDGIVYLVWAGYSAEGIRTEYPTLTLAQIEGAISFYLEHKDEVDEYMRQRNRNFEKLRAEAEARPNPARDRLRAMKTAKVEAYP